MGTLGFLQNLGWPELLVILAILVLLFGHKLPGLGRALGRSIGEFKGGLKEGQEEAAKSEAAPAKPPAQEQKKA
jgi:TatA/E family protein of Tat protein translocase